MTKKTWREFYLHAPDEAADEVEAEDEADEAIAGPIPPDGPPEATLDSGSSFAPGVPPD